MKFCYEGFTSSGEVKRGEVDAASEVKVAEMLRDQGIYAQRIEEKGPEPMKTVLPGGPPIESSSDPVRQDPAPSYDPDVDLQEPPLPRQLQNDWRTDLRIELVAINDVVTYCGSLGIPEDARRDAASKLALRVLAKAVAGRLGEIRS